MAVDESLVPIKGDSYAAVVLGRDHRPHKCQFSPPQQLLGCEVMLFFPVGARIRRAGRAFLSENENDAATRFVRGQGEPTYIVMKFQRALAKPKHPPSELAAERPAEDQGALFTRAITFARERKQVTNASE